jgi:hypothetical protein
MMAPSLLDVFTTAPYHPHGFCYLWKPGLVGMHVISDLLIGASYVAISTTLGYLVYRGRRHIPFSWVFLAFGTFIVACGATHFMEVWTLWNATYWFSGSVKLITAAASVATAVVLPPLVPRVLAMIEASELAERRKDEIETAHAELKRLYEELRQARDVLEQELTTRNKNLAEMARELVQSQGITRTILETAVDGIITIDERGGIQSLNPAAERLFGYTPDELIGKNVNVLMPSPYRENHDGYLGSYLHTGVRKIIGVGREVVGLRKDGQTFPMELGVSEVALENGRIFTGIVRDISERKRASEELALTLGREQAARLDAERANRAKDEFLAVVSHELRTPLTAMLGWARVLRSGKLDPAGVERALDTIERNTRSQAQLIEDLLDVARITSGKLRLDVRRVELIQVIEAAIEALRPAADAKTIAVQSILDPRGGPIAGDPERLQQVVWNLLSNAIKFTPKGGTVQVRLERVDSHVEILVADTGKGIGAEFLPYVFDRFRQADSATNRTHGGLGLGLAIVRHLVEAHGGSVSVDSSGEGQGTIFTVKLPILAVSDKQLPSDRVHPTARNDAAVPVLDGTRLGGLRILVVDDEPETLEMLAAVLSGCGAEVHTAASATDAFAELARWHPDLLISDIGMPGEDGYGFIQRVRALDPEQGGRVPALALTAYARVEDRVRVLSAGFQMHVPKPIEPAELVAMVGNLAEWHH